MPTIVVETGAGLSNSNSYVSLSQADAYFLDHPYYADAWGALGIPDKEKALISAASALDALITWRGYIFSSAQALSWPRLGVVDDEGRVISSVAVPQRVKNAQLEIAYHVSRGDPYAVPASQGLERLKIDVIELQFSGSTVAVPIPAAALVALRGLGEYALGSRVRKVLVG